MAGISEYSGAIMQVKSSSEKQNKIKYFTDIPPVNIKDFFDIHHIID